MANKEHVEVLAGGFRRWNEWRQEEIEVKPDLSGIDLSGASLEEIDFSETDLSQAQLVGTGFNGADFQRSDLRGANLSGATLYRADLREADLRRANLIGANLSESDLRGADLTETDNDRTIFTKAKVTDRTRGLDGLRLSVRVGLDHEQPEPKDPSVSEESDTRPVDPEVSTSTETLQQTPATPEESITPNNLTQSREALTELLEKLEGFVPQGMPAADTNREPIPLTRHQYETAVAAVKSALAFHEVESVKSWDRKIRDVISRLTGILEDLEVLGRQFGKTVGAWALVGPLLRKVITGLRAMLELSGNEDEANDE